MTVLEHYRKLRNNNGPARYCLNIAKQYAEIDKLWEDAEKNGMVRIRIEPDDMTDYDDLVGDCYDVELNQDSVPGGARTIIAQGKAFQRTIERDGIWGYIAEYCIVCDTCGRDAWEYAESCWGFAGEVYEEALYDGKYAALQAAGMMD